MSKDNIRVTRTRAHDTLLFTTERHLGEKYKTNVLYKGAMLWNLLTVSIRNIESYNCMKKYLKSLAFKQTVPFIIV